MFINLGAFWFLLLLSTPYICTFHTPTCNAMQQNVGLTAVAIQQSFTKTPQNTHKSTTTRNPFHARPRVWNEVFQKQDNSLFRELRPTPQHKASTSAQDWARKECVSHKFIYCSPGPMQARDAQQVFIWTLNLRLSQNILFMESVCCNHEHHCPQFSAWLNHTALALQLVFLLTLK